MRGALPRNVVFAVLAAAWGIAHGLAGVPDGDGTPWYQALSMYHFPHFFSVDVNGAEMLPLIRNSTADFVLVEFYAPWCPHCQHFAPEFERLALAISRFNDTSGQNRSAGILSGTVDCVRYAATCDEWGVQAFPTLLWGRRGDWLDKAREKLQEVTMAEPTAEAVASWIDGQASVHLDPSRVSRRELFTILRAHVPEQEQAMLHRPNATSPSGALQQRADLWDVQVAAALLLHTAMAEQLTADTEEVQTSKRNALQDLVDLLARRLPEAAPGGQCQASLADLGRHLQGGGQVAGGRGQSSARRLGDGDGAGRLRGRLWQEARSWAASEAQAARMDPDVVEKRWRLCGTDWATYGQRGWRSCRGTWPGKRGFTCGLWTLFHTVAARVEDESAAKDTAAMRGAISNFFACSECRSHFLKIPFGPEDTANRSAVQLWWWKAHNNVNERVKAFEDQYQDGDPAYPKVQWPTPEECPTCHRKVDTKGASPEAQEWDLDAVGHFLARYYGA